MSAKKRRADGKAQTRRPQARRTGKQRAARVAKILAIVGVVGALVLGGVVVVLYQAISIPEPNEDFEAQTTFVYYRDGEQQLGTYYEDQNRVSIPLGDMPESMQDAVVAAENQTFWTDKGIDPKGIARALFSNARGNDRQGASTITQQYVKILYLTSEQSYKRKIREAVVSLKIQQELSKEEVLEGYLNTIYFGRGAYGIEAASEAYFDHPAKDLNLRESAVLATVLNNPSKYDPANGKEAKDDLKGRYAYVLDSMAEMETITPEQRDKALKKLPKFPKIAAQSQFGGQRGHMLTLVKQELLAKRHRLGGGDRRRWPAHHHDLRPGRDGRRRGGRRRAAPRRRHARPRGQQGPAHRRRHRRHRDGRAARLLRRPGLPGLPDQLGGRRRHGRLDDEGRHRRRRHPRRLLAQRHLRGQQPHRHRRHRVRATRATPTTARPSR